MIFYIKNINSSNKMKNGLKIIHKLIVNKITKNIKSKINTSFLYSINFLII